ncbi:MAG TPA: hypothetical protein VFS31_15005 [Chitinophagaceae bacterium]|jgi:hypothetical protein|nr:hypothetical protein [Chitinophagaceae bacterium]
MPKQQTYKEALVTALKSLDEAQGYILEGAVNIAMVGPYKELGRLHEPGEVLDINADMLRDTGDQNIDLILELADALEAVKEKISNINALNL